MRPISFVVVLIGIIALAAPVRLQANEAPPPGPAHISPYPGVIPDSLGPIVDTIIIDNRNVFNTSEPRYDHFLFKLANRIHYTTRKSVIREEILFKVGAPYAPQLAQETARNIRARLPVYDAWITTDTLPNGHLKVTVVTIDEWTLAVGPSFNRDGNEYRYELAATERNLFGRNQELRFHYVVQEKNPNYINTSYYSPRGIAGRYAVRLTYNSDPRDGVASFVFSRPFYSLTQDFAYSIAVSRTDGRRDFYRDDSLIAGSSNTGDRVEFRMATRSGSYSRKLTMNLGYVYRYERNYDEFIRSASPSDSSLARSSFPDDSLYHLTRFGLQFSNLNFTTMKRIDGFTYTEDFTLGQGAAVSYGRAFTAAFDDHWYEYVSVRLAQGYRIRNNLAYLDYIHEIWFRGHDNLRRLAILTGYFYSRAAEYLTIAARARYQSDWHRDAVNGLVLGGTTGLRGYNKYFVTGDRIAVANLEARFFPNIRIHSALLGPLVFADFGEAWKDGEPIEFRHTYAAVGVGLRVGLEHSRRGRVLRFDVAYSKEAGWQLSIGTDHYFRAADTGFLLTSP